jgi:hypothetical protein
MHLIIKTLSVSYNGTIKIETAIAGADKILFSKFEMGELIEINLIAKMDSKKPTVNEPASPINILAGLKLNNKKPNNAPDNAKAINAKPD